MGRRPLKRAPADARQRDLFDRYEHLVGWTVGRIGRWRAARAGCEVDDLMQAGRIGLWLATYRWVEGRGAFANAAIAGIRGEVIDCIDRARFGRRRAGRDLVDQSRFARLPTEHDDPW